MWCTPEQDRAARKSSATKKQQSVQQPVFASVPAAPQQRQRPVRVPPQSAVAFPRLASEDTRDRPYTESERRSVAEMMARLRRGDDLRADKVERVREALSVGDYENEMKLDIAIDRMLDELNT
jgi:hypothetical protein